MHCLFQGELLNFFTSKFLTYVKFLYFLCMLLLYVLYSGEEIVVYTYIYTSNAQNWWKNLIT